MNLKSKAISNTVYLALDWFFVTLFSFCYSYVIWKNLSPEHYGIITTAVNLMMPLGVMTLFGANNALTKLLPEYIKTKKNRKINSLIKLSIRIFIISNLVLTPILFVLAPYLASILKTTQTVIWLIIIGTIVFSFFYLTSAIVYGYQNMKLYFKTAFIGNLIKFLSSTVLIFFAFQHFGPIIGVILGFSLISLFRIKKSWFTLKSDNFLNKKKIILEYFLPAFIGTISWIIFNNTHYIILTILHDPSATGIYAMAMTVTIPILLIPLILNQAIFPITSLLCVVKDAKKRQAYLIDTVLRYTLLLTLPLAILLIIFFKSLILLLKFKFEYLGAAQFLPILSPAVIIFGCGSIILSSLYAIRKPKINRDISIFTAMIFLFLSVTLTYLFSAYGLSFAYLISATILFLSSFFYIRKYISLSFQTKNILKIFISSIIFFLICYVTDVLTINFFIKLILIFFGILVYLLVLLFLKFYKIVDVKILEFLGHKIPFFGRYILVIAEFLKNRI